MEKRKKKEDDEEGSGGRASPATSSPRSCRYRSLRRFKCVSRAWLATRAGRPLARSVSCAATKRSLAPLYCCGGGILICYCWRVDMEEAEYFVCDPARATEEIWAVLTAPRNELIQELNNTRLRFDPAIPRRFAVFVFMHDLTGIIRVEVSFLARIQDVSSLMAPCIWLPLIQMPHHIDSSGFIGQSQVCV